jgi:hypothetical protein
MGLFCRRINAKYHRNAIAEVQIMEQPRRQVDRTTIYIEPALHDRLKAEARRAVRSVNGEIIYRLKQSLDNKSTQAEEAAAS